MPCLKIMSIVSNTGLQKKYTQMQYMFNNTSTSNRSNILRLGFKGSDWGKQNIISP
jgi:hypothetical protein